MSLISINIYLEKFLFSKIFSQENSYDDCTFEERGRRGEQARTSRRGRRGRGRYRRGRRSRGTERGGAGHGLDQEERGYQRRPRRGRGRGRGGLVAEDNAEQRLIAHDHQLQVL